MHDPEPPHIAAATIMENPGPAFAVTGALATLGGVLASGMTGCVVRAATTAAIVARSIIGSSALANMAGGIIGTASLANVAGGIICAAGLTDMSGRIVAAAALADMARRIVGTAPG